MATKVIGLVGEALYAKVFEDNRDMEGFEGAYEECNGATTIEVLLDDVEYQKLQDTGSKVEGRIDEDTGLHRVKFKRKWEVRDKEGNLIEPFCGAPRVVDADGEPWPHTPDMPSYIGNGSRVKVAVSVTPNRKKKNIVYTRLEGVQVLDLEEWDGEAGQLKLPF